MIFNNKSIKNMDSAMEKQLKIKFRQELMTSVLKSMNLMKN